LSVFFRFAEIVEPADVTVAFHRRFELELEQIRHPQRRLALALDQPAFDPPPGDATPVK